MNNQETANRGPVQGIVAQILSVRELVINRGSADGVQKRMKFKVLSEAPLEITDPETGEILGEIDREKVRVRAVEVKESFTICETYETRAIGRIDYWALTEHLRPLQKVPVTLKVEDSQFPEPLPEEQSYVKVGDRVIQIPSSE